MIFIFILLSLLLINNVKSKNSNFGYKRFINNQDLTSTISKKLTDFDLFSLGDELDSMKQQIELSQKDFNGPICAIFFNDQIEKISNYQAPIPWPSSFISSTTANDSNTERLSCSSAL